jgi:hypothetical protein
MSNVRHADETETVATPVRYRATFTFPADLATDINRLAKRLGVSQSSLLTELLGDPIRAMLEVIDEIPQVGATPDHVKRARGKSAALIRDVVQQAQAVVASLGPDEPNP